MVIQELQTISGLIPKTQQAGNTNLPWTTGAIRSGKAKKSLKTMTELS